MEKVLEGSTVVRPWYQAQTSSILGKSTHHEIVWLSTSAAMTWQPSEFDHEDGVTTMLKKLSKPPLVRKTLPNAASIMAQYFEFRRLQGENISAFLIRENLHFEEFRECLICLREEQSGVDYGVNNFGLPAAEIGDTGPPQGDEDESSEDLQSPDLSARRQRYARVPQTEAEPAETAPIDEAVLSMSDSFILEQLRGWRLLTSASLNQEEWRDVLLGSLPRQAGLCQH